MKRFLAPMVLALSACSAVSAAAADYPPEVTWTMADFKTDGTGKIWGVGVPHDGELIISSDPDNVVTEFRRDTLLWQPYPWAAAPPEMKPQLLANLADGKVACLWKDGERTTFTRHRGDQQEKWCTLEVIFNEPSFHALPDGGLVVTESGLHVAIIPPDGLKPQLLVLADDLMVPPSDANARLVEAAYRRCSPMRAVEVGEGRLWLWTEAREKQVYSWSINGILEIKGDKLEHVTGLPFQAESMLGAVVAEDKEHVFAAECGVGLWRINLSDNKGTLIECPPNALDYVGLISFLNDGWYFLTRPECGLRTLLDNAVRQDLSVSKVPRKGKGVGRDQPDVLWRLEGGRAVAVVDTTLSLSSPIGPSRPLAAHTKGLLLGCFYDHPWWIPADRTAVPFMLSSADGFETKSLVDAVSLEDKGLLIRSQEGDCSVLPVPGIKPRPATTRLISLSSRSMMLQDDRRHVWVVGGRDDGLMEWDGKSWHLHAVALDERHPGSREFAADSHGHGWMLPQGDGATVVVDFATGGCRTFFTMEQAVEEVLAPGDSVKVKGYAAFTPIAHRGGNKAFISSRPDMVHVYRQGKWVRWNFEDVVGDDIVNMNAGSRQAPNVPLKAGLAPFFDDDGRFCVPLGRAFYALGEDDKWTVVEGPPGSNDQGYGDQHQRPAGCRIPSVQGVAHDRYGVAWITSGSGELWKWLDGRSVQIKDGMRSRLFAGTFRIAQVLYDARGNVFLGEGTFGEGCLMMARPAPATRPAALGVIKGRNATVNLNVTPATTKRWRLDKEAWQWAGAVDSLRLDDLQPGAHAVEVQTFDDQLSPVGEMQSIRLMIELLNPDMLAQQIKLLGSADVTIREEAARDLKVQGPKTLPVLKQALEQAKEDATLQWWLQAVIQEIERRGAAKPEAGS